MSDWSAPTNVSRLHEPLASDDDLVDDIVAGCVENGSAELDGRLGDACREYPHLASQIRRRIESLREIGLLNRVLEADDRFPERLGDFRLLERLGGGGMGIVFRAHQESLARDVALKLIRPEQLYFPRARERFQRETEAVARLQHPGIVPIYAVGDENGVPYFAMELVHGCTLVEALQALHPTAPERLTGEDLWIAILRCVTSKSRSTTAPRRPALFEGSYVCAIVELVIQVANALEHAHARGVLHRDIKPSNVAVTPDGRALLFDFGLAGFATAAQRLTATRAEIGSLHYMAPEQVRGDNERTGEHSDVYGLGVTLYELLALQLPYSESDPLQTRHAILEGRCDPLRARNRAVPRDLELVCAKAMNVDEGGRYASAAEFAADLRNVLEHRPIRARSPSTWLIASRWVRRHPAISAAIAVGLLCASGIPTALFVQKAVYASQLSDALAEAKAQREAANTQRALADAARTEATAQRDRAQKGADQAEAANLFLVHLFDGLDPTRNQGREVTGRELLDEGVRRLDVEFLEYPLVRARLLHSLGSAYAGLGDWERAEELMTRGLELREEHSGPASLDVAESLRDLANVEHQIGRPGALDRGQRALEMYLALTPQPTYELADALVTQGMALVGAGRVAEAGKDYEKALEIQSKLPGDQRDLRATVLAHLANLWQRCEREEDALDAAREGIQLFHELGHVVHPGITSCLGAMALALVKLERFDEARAVYDELLEFELLATGPESPRVASFIGSRSNLELRTGHVDEAIATLERANAMFERVAPPTHFSATTCRAMLARAYMLATRWDDARAVLEELEDTLDSSAGPASVIAISNHVQLAQCYEAASDWTEAEAQLTAALERASEAHSPDDDATEAMAAAFLARLIARPEHGDLAGARRLVARARELRCDREPVNCVTAWVRLAAGVIAFREGDERLARVELEPIAALERAPVVAETTPAVARARLAAVLARSDAANARELALRARGELERQLGAEHPETRAVTELLDQLR